MRPRMSTLLGVSTSRNFTMRRSLAVAFASFAVPFSVAVAQAPPAAPPAQPAAAAAPAAPAPVVLNGLKDNEYLAICGDSITEQKLYSVYIEDYLLMCKPHANVKAAQFGWGGETVGGFLHRMSNVLRFPV